MKGLFISVLMILIGILSGMKSVAQPFSALLTVRYAGVSIQRTATLQEFSISQGAQMPFGAGDILRTDDTGRALITLGSIGEWLILPNSTLMLHEFSYNSPTWSLSATLNGVLIHSFKETSSLEYHLQTQDFDITNPALHSAVWSYEEQPDVFTVITGIGEIQLEGVKYILEANQAFWGDIAHPLVVTHLEPPLNAPRVEAHLFGCNGEIETVDNVGVLVRRGIGTGQERLGLIPDQAQVSVMASNESGYWLRIQYLSGFSWIVGNTVKTSCNNLKKLPDNTPIERFLQVVNPLQSEVTLLQPFYQTPLQDTFFYQFSAP